MHKVLLAGVFGVALLAAGAARAETVQFTVV